MINRNLKQLCKVIIFFEVFFSIRVFAQAPNIAYVTPQTYTLNTAITPLQPINTGGAVPATVYGQVSTFAGSGMKGSANGTGTAASFYSPGGIVTDASGNLYVADALNNLIRKITPAGVVSTLAGSGSRSSIDGTGTSASFIEPSGITVDASGTVYVTDGSSNIRKISPAGVVTTLAGSGSVGSANGTGAAASFNGPYGITIDASGNLYVADLGNNLIRKISPPGVVTTLAGSGLTGSADGTGTAASFYDPYGVAVDASGNVYVTDNGNSLIRKVSPAGVVTTLAGTGSHGSANGTGTAASFYYPEGITLDALGNIYIVDEFNQLIRKINPAGVVSTLAGSGLIGSANGTGTTASFSFPNSVATDASGNVYVSDEINNLIRKITVTGYTISPTLPSGLSFDATTGIISGTPTAAMASTAYTVTAYNLAGSSTATLNIAVLTAAPTITSFTPALAAGGATVVITGTGFTGATAVNFGGATATSFTINSDTQITAVVGLGASGSVSVITPKGTATLVGFTFNTPVVIAAPSIAYATPQIYTVNRAIMPLVPTNSGGAVPVAVYGQVSTFAGSGSRAPTNGIGTAAGFANPSGVVTDASGNVYVTDFGDNLIREISPAAIVSTFAGNLSNGLVNGTGTAASFYSPYGITTDVNGNFYVADFNNNVIRKISPAGVVSTLAGSGSAGYVDGIGASTSFGGPKGVATDASGNVYVADTYNSLIRKITPLGVVTTLAGSRSVGSSNGTGAAATFNLPNGVATDALGNVYVTDAGNNLIRKISPAGVVTTLAGNGSRGSTNGTATSASFNNPSGITLDASGNVYVADYNNYLIRMISPAGTVTTLAGSGSFGSTNGIGTAASFYYPAGLALDGSRNLYVADYNNNLIRKITITGYSIDKALPPGLTFDATTGTISGTPTAISPAANYVITGFNATGSSSFTVNIQVVTAATSPVATTQPATGITSTTATLNGLVNDNGAATTVTLTYGTTANISAAITATITTGINPVTAGTGNANFTSLLTGLNPSTTYYFGITAQNSIGITNGAILSFTTSAPAATSQIITFAQPATVTYGSADIAAGASSNNSGVTVTYSSGNPLVATIVNGNLHITGAGTTVITASQAGDATHSQATPVSQTLTVLPAPLNITADNQSRIYGMANPALTVSYTGFVNGENATQLINQPTVSTTAVITSMVGTYPITVMGATAANYLITYTTGTLTVTLTPQTITFATSLTTKIYGDADAALMASSTSGLAVSYASSNTSVATVVNGNLHITGAGTTVITASQPGNANYNPATPVTQTCTVNPAPLTITAVNQSRVYGIANPALTVSYTGFVNGDAVSNLSSPPVGSTTASSTSGIGSYPIIPGGAVSPNYAIAYVSGILLVTPATRTITFNTISINKTYGDADFDPGAVSSSGELILYTTSDITIATVVNGKIHIVAAGTVTITATVAQNSNYTSTPVITETLTVDKAPQSIQFTALAPPYITGSSLALNYTSSSGLPVSVSSSDASIAALSGTSLILQKPGTVTITLSLPGNSNYLDAATITQTIIVQNVTDNIVFHLVVTPNGDGKNDYLMIEGIENYPQNHLVIASRNGVKIFECSGYDNHSNTFVGNSSINGSLQPQGTYFYLLDYTVNGKQMQQKGFLVLKY